MRSIIIGLVILSIGVDSCQFNEKRIPDTVILNFNSRFPEAKNVKWSTEKKMFEAVFWKDGKEIATLFDRQGQLLEVETKVSIDQLPPAIVNSIKMQFPGYKIDKAEKIESNQPVIYELEISKNRDEGEVYLDSEGRVLKEVKVDD